MGTRGPIPQSVGGQGGRAVGEADRLHCPDWLSSEAKCVWNRTLAGLTPFGHMHPADATALGRYCELWTLWRKLVKARDAASDQNDATCIRLERRAIKVSVALLALEDRFGLNPASRGRLGLTVQAAEPTPDPRLRFFRPRTDESD